MNFNLMHSNKFLINFYEFFLNVVFDVNFEKFIVELHFIIISSMFEKF